MRQVPRREVMGPPCSEGEIRSPSGFFFFPPGVCDRQSALGAGKQVRQSAALQKPATVADRSPYVRRRPSAAAVQSVRRHDSVVINDNKKSKKTFLELKKQKKKKDTRLPTARHGSGKGVVTCHFTVLARCHYLFLYIFFFLRHCCRVKKNTGGGTHHVREQGLYQ
jgi:hypothetical protein